MLASTAGCLLGVTLLMVLLVGACLEYASQTPPDPGRAPRGPPGLCSSRYIGDLIEVSEGVINTGPVVVAVQYTYDAAGDRGMQGV